MELFQLRYFAEAARQLNFTRAAAACFISQPSLSAQIAALEREVGTELFSRSGRAVRLTDAGATLLEYAERLIALEAEGLHAVRAVVGLERGRLGIATLPTPGQHLLPSALAAFRKAHPDIEITVQEMVPARLVGETVAGGRADLGIVQLSAPDARFPVANLSQQILLVESLFVVVPVGHRFENATPTLADLADETFVWVPEGASPEHPIYAACLAAGFTPKIACICGSASGMQALVAAGLGIALLPRLALVPRPETVIVPLAPDPRTNEAPTRTLAVVWRSDETRSHAARVFLEFVVRGA